MCPERSGFPACKKFLYLFLRLKHFIDCRIVDKTAFLHAVTDHLSDLGISDLAAQERLDSQLVCGIKDSREVSALADRFIGELQRGESLHIGLFKGHLAKLVEIHFLAAHGSALGIVQRVLDGKAHVRKAEFRDDGFYLNGVRRVLRGVNCHQETEGKGWALSEADVLRDISLMKEMGADWLPGLYIIQTDHGYSKVVKGKQE